MDHLNGLDLAGKAVQDSPAPPKLKLRTQAGLSKKRIESRRTRRDVVPPSPCPLIDTDWREQLPHTLLSGGWTQLSAAASCTSEVQTA